MASNFDTLSDNAKKLITLSKKGGSDVNYQVLIETVDQSGGAKSFDQIATFEGGRLKNHRPQEAFEITLEGYAVEVGTDTGSTGKGFYDLMYTSDTSQPQSISLDHTRDEWRLSIMATDNFDQTSAADVTITGDKANRWTFTNGHFTNVVFSDTDKLIKFTITYKVTPFNKIGSANVVIQSTDGTATKVLPALSAYT